MKIFLLLFILTTIPAEDAILTGQSNALMIRPRMLSPYRIHKFARMGRSITNWTEGDYYNKSIEGVITCSVLFFLQGERDARDGMIKNDYYNHLHVLMERYRNRFPGIIIVIHHVTGEVGQAQEEYAGNHADVNIVDARDIGRVHYFGNYRTFVERLLLAAGYRG